MRLVQICLQEKEKDTYDFSILSRDELSIDQEWQLHATGEVYVKMEHERGKRETDFSEFNTWTMDRNQPEQGTYALMKSSGFKLGDGFRRMIKTAHNDEVEGEYVCQIIPCDKIPDKDNYIIYPGTIDSVFQTGTLSEVTKRVEESNGVIADEINETIIPYFMSEFTYNYRDVKEIQSYVNITITNFPLICAIIGGLGSIASQLGDLAASSIKRYVDIKDYGYLFPGHGGVLDRFDSILFTAPFVYYIVLLINYLMA